MPEINFEDYLTDAQRQEIIECEFREYAKGRAKEDYERVATNGAYQIVWEYLDKQHDGNLEKIIKKKAEDVVSNLSSFDVFRVRGIGEPKNSVAREVLDKAIRANSDLVEERVKSLIKDLSRVDIWELLEDRDVTFNG
ncbi:hypothetical protein [Cohaesibacter celericrescens]|uniref:hypothetical protein n=1 Tax=Cohaesibacter celericrescens TaxID=2067669 RepID=UPI003564704D